MCKDLGQLAGSDESDSVSRSHAPLSLCNLPLKLL